MSSRNLLLCLQRGTIDICIETNVGIRVLDTLPDSSSTACQNYCDFLLVTAQDS